MGFEPAIDDELDRFFSLSGEMLSIIGFDDIRFAAHTSPPLTTIAQPMRQIGEGTVRLLLSILADGEDAETPPSVTLPHKLIVRASTAPPLNQRA